MSEAIYRVYKYPLRMDDYVRLELPAGSEVLCVQMQYGHPQIWVLVDIAQQQTETRTFRIAGTGHDITPSGSLLYISTFQMQNGALVFHVFEVLPLHTEW